MKAAERNCARPGCPSPARGRYAPHRESLFCSDACRETYARDCPYSLACSECDADGPGSESQARAAGWMDLTRDVEGYGWNYLGLCPDCHQPALFPEG